MSSASYRLESFHQWKPSNEKVQPFRNRLGLSRYPSPVSICVTPSNPSLPLSQSQEMYVPTPGRHPLPARPPAEVCLNRCLQSNTQHKSEDLAPTSPINPGPQTFDIEDSLYLTISLPLKRLIIQCHSSELLRILSINSFFVIQVARRSNSLLIGTLNLSFLKGTFLRGYQRSTRQPWTIVILHTLRRPKRRQLLLSPQPPHAKSQVNRHPLFKTSVATAGSRPL